MKIKITHINCGGEVILGCMDDSGRSCDRAYAVTAKCLKCGETDITWLPEEEGNFFK